ncbi:MAG: trehalose-phosphatase [Nitrospira sp.]|nr:trehalose-phosphatase [Nitrospira sp.]
MIYLLSEEGRQALKTATDRPILYAFDFDGTLAKISRERRSVKLAPTTHEWLTELAKRASCAIVSGRALDDLRPRVNGAVSHLIGNHGVEGPLTPPVALQKAERTCLEWMTQIDRDLAGLFKDTGVEVENKRYTLTFHYRCAKDLAAVERTLVLLLDRLTPAPRLIGGKASVNALPPGNIGKGAATLDLMVHLRCRGLFFVGDDETDEDVFGLGEGLIMGVRVGHEAGSRARYYLKHQDEIEDVIRFIVHRLDGTPDIAGQILRSPGGTVKPA